MVVDHEADFYYEELLCQGRLEWKYDTGLSC
jgi:hypothetical protein